MDLKKYRGKLIGDDDERAVSPVIGVILMVAITVILAAVIAAFVLDMGDSLGQEAQSGAQMSFDESDKELSVQLTSEGNADTWQLRGDYHHNDGTSVDVVNGDTHPYEELSGAGDSIRLECQDSANIADGEYDIDEDDETGTVTFVASNDGGDSWTTVGSQDWDCTD